MLTHMLHPSRCYPCCTALEDTAGGDINNHSSLNTTITKTTATTITTLPAAPPPPPQPSLTRTRVRFCWSTSAAASSTLSPMLVAHISQSRPSSSGGADRSGGGNLQHAATAGRCAAGAGDGSQGVSGSSRREIPSTQQATGQQADTLHVYCMVKRHASHPWL